jgi:formiminotetrahydrofolate cyclodeaminase
MMSIATAAEVEALLKVIDPEDNATGGGTASAVAGALASGLAGMVARVSRGRADMEPDAFYDDIDEAARGLARSLLAGGLADSEAFGRVMQAYRLPKDSPDDKAARSLAIQAALQRATAVPLDNGEQCAEVLDLLARLTPNHNTNASSDLDVGRRLALAALQGCIDNVDINLGSLKDEDVRAGFEVRLNLLRSVAAAALEGSRV